MNEESKVPRRTGRDVLFVLFALAAVAALIWMTVRDPQGIKIGLTAVVAVGFVVMAIGRYRLSRRRGVRRG